MDYEEQLSAAKFRAERDLARQEVKELREELDAMRPRLMPEGMEWLRYDTGEPVPLGGEVTVTVHDEDGDFDRTLAIRSIKYKENGVLLEGTGNEMVILSLGERVKRPAPKVLDADGVEIRVGDEVWSTNGEFDGKRIVKSVHHDSDEPPYALFEEWCAPWSCLCCYLTHRAPVLAADGEPLEAGQTVYGIGRTQHRFVVRAVSDYEEDEPDGRFCVPCIDKDDGDEECWCDPSQLTHQRPVLDADGVPIKKGDTVWFVGGGEPAEVAYTITADASHPDEVVLKGYEDDWPVNADKLTHTNPEQDSWEKVEKDILIGPCDYFGFPGLDDPCCECPAYGSGCHAAKEKDLVRRCKKLAGASE